MDLPPNKLREKLADGHRGFGTALFSWSPNVVDVLGDAGLDYLRIDTEHAYRRDNMLEQLIRAAIMAHVVPIVRIDKGNPSLARKVLEIGAGGIVVPNVCTIEDARAVVRAAKFPPLGNRGYSSNCLSAAWGEKSGKEWVAWSNREPMIGIMIENVAAMNSLDEIVCVDGIDFVLFGPADYSMSLGLGAPMPRDERVQEAIDKVVDAAHKAGRYVSLGVGTDPANIEMYLERGIDMLELGNDLGIIRAALKSAIPAGPSSH